MRSLIVLIFQKKAVNPLYYDIEIFRENLQLDDQSNEDVDHSTSTEISLKEQVNSDEIEEQNPLL